MLKWSVEAKEVWKKNVSLIWLVMYHPIYYHYSIGVYLLEMKGCTKFLICLCSLGVVSSFSVNTPDFSKNQSKNGASSQRFRPNLKRQQTMMTLSPQLLKSGIATYGIIIGAGGLVAGNLKTYYVRSECQWIRLMDKCSSIAGIKTGSKPSIISSALASIVLAVAYTVCTRLISLYCWTNIFALQRNSLAIALGTTIALSVVFAIRFLKTKKLVPAGILGLLSLGFSTFFSYLKWAGAA